MHYTSKLRLGTVALLASLTLFGCSSGDSASDSAKPTSKAVTSSGSAATSEAGSSPAADPDSAELCGIFQEINTLDAASGPPDPTDWAQVKPVLIDRLNKGNDLYVQAADVSTDETVQADLKSLGELNTAILSIITSSNTIEEFTTGIEQTASVDAVQAAQRLQAYSKETCGFPLSTGGA